MDPVSILKPYDPRLLASKEGRVVATRMDPALFALLYLKHHISAGDGTVSFARAHDDWADLMKDLAIPQQAPRSWRHCFVAPRATGKSTWFYLIAPMWAAAHNHSRFTAAFADTSSQAETHLATFRSELIANDLLRNDYPDLCMPGPTDTRSMYIARSGFVFAARGADTSSLGLKVGATRPDLLLLDDVEPGESNYSPYLAEKRLQTLLEVILPLNEFARVLMVGTVTMADSIIHQLTIGEEPWIADENFKTVHHHALFDDENGDPQSIWPEKWPVEFLQSISHTKAFAKNFQNSVTSGGGDYWDLSDITYADAPTDLTRTVLAIDPAVTSKTTSDYTGIAVVTSEAGTMYLRHTDGVKLSGRGLRQKVEQILRKYPEIRVLIVETNQGGDIWREVFAGLPVRYRPVFSKEAKHVRAGELLEHYQRNRIVHVKGINDRKLVEELLGFPDGARNDDRLDAVASAARYLAPLSNRRFHFRVA